MNDIPERYKSRDPGQALAHLIEECGEVTAAAGKTARWGFYSSNPELPLDQREMNVDWVLREVADLERAITAFRYFAENMQRPTRPD